jgi:hypothetical protein
VTAGCAQRATSSAPTTCSSSGAQEHGWAHSDRFSVGLDLELDDDLRREGRVYDLVPRAEPSCARSAGSTSRPDHADDPGRRPAAEYAERIKAETLAVEVKNGSGLDLERV